MKKLFALCLALALLLTSVSALADGSAVMPVFAEIESGKLIGYTQGGVNCFLGIPYGTAERFEMATKVEPWEDYRYAMTYGNICPVAKTNMNNFDFMSRCGEIVENEDSCLNINVWTPTMDTTAKKPVIFWMHGGGFGSGSSNELTIYEGRNLAAFGDVVFVSINHRLNVLGFTDLSNYGEEFKYSGNVGMADIVLALEWVRDNIEQFGGDPNNVTIEGQSGGGSKVTTLMGMPAAKGLFHKAVAQSGGSAKTTRTTETAAAAGTKLVEKCKETYADVTTDEEAIAKLQSIPYTELRALSQGTGVGSGPVVDGDYYPDGTMELSKDIPFMRCSLMGEFQSNGMYIFNYPYKNGIITEEQLKLAFKPMMTEESINALLTKTYGDAKDEVLAAFRKAYPGHDDVDVLFTTARDNALVDAKVSYGGAPVYQAVVSFNQALFGGLTTLHTSGDIALFFRNLEQARPFFEGDWEKADEVSKLMAQALVNFAYTGNPSQEGLEWPAYTTESGATMIFDRESHVDYYHDVELTKLLKTYRNPNMW